MVLKVLKLHSLGSNPSDKKQSQTLTLLPETEIQARWIALPIFFKHKQSERMHSAEFKLAAPGNQKGFLE